MLRAQGKVKQCDTGCGLEFDNVGSKDRGGLHRMTAEPPLIRQLGTSRERPWFSKKPSLINIRCLPPAKQEESCASRMDWNNELARGAPAEE